ncbi:hypothetical protein RLOC_00006099 [Lonchura striata]|uniref:Uncharacterized protein n=1 Tax=Lonchura striata TaxID=40157 RepID=A0A218UY18_9PASE|nr:hypothetical protein RLOC_00006099 [Lonchura striata domestica]
MFSLPVVAGSWLPMVHFFPSNFISILFPVVVKLREGAESFLVIKQSLCGCMNQLQAWTQCTQGTLWRAGTPVSPTGMPGHKTNTVKSALKLTVH